MRLLVRLQSIYQYTDSLMEQPSSNPVANARELHTAIEIALQPGRPHIDYYRHDSHAGTVAIWSSWWTGAARCLSSCPPTT